MQVLLPNEVAFRQQPFPAQAENRQCGILTKPWSTGSADV